MMEFDEIVVKESPGLCRCCLSEGCYKDMGSEYAWMNETEVYADMLLECFDISITQHNEGPNGPNRLICEVCITRLRDACNFKKQVLDSEKKFVDMVGRGEFRPKVLIYQTQMKAETGEVHATEEVEYLDDDLDADDDEPLKRELEIEPSISDITVEAMPVKNKRGRPKKTATVTKPEKKIKLMKIEDKPRSSKAVTKGKRLKKKSIDKPDRRRNIELRRLLTIILENSTIVPFKWFSNKYMCFYCGCPFIESSKLKLHMKEEHEDAKLTRALQGLQTSSKIKLDISWINCKRCPKELQTLDQLLDHISMVHDLKFNRDVSRYIFTFKLTDSDISCHHCGEKFKFFGTLLRHVHKYHNSASVFVCEFCGQGFVAKCNVDGHIKNVHSDQTKCTKCEKVFPDFKSLKHHNDSVHNNAFKCPQCSENFSNRYRKERHLALVHDVKCKQFACDECQQVFTKRSYLGIHKARLHLKEKTITCEICGFKVFDKNSLKHHMVKHDDSRPFECDICMKTFQRKKTMVIHRRIHTNDKRYVCKECGRAFVQTTSLKLHLRVHHSVNNENTSWT